MSSERAPTWSMANQNFTLIFSQRRVPQEHEMADLARGFGGEMVEYCYDNDPDRHVLIFLTFKSEKKLSELQENLPTDWKLFKEE